MKLHSIFLRFIDRTSQMPDRRNEYFSQICDSLFRISFTTGAGTFHATGFVIANFIDPKNITFALATAEHTFKRIRTDENVHWTVERFDLHGNLQNSFKFKSNIEKMGDGPLRLHLKSDLGILYVPAGDFVTKPVRLLDPRCAIGSAGRVAWAGFPAFAKEKTATPQPCYFEGVISTVVDRVESEERLFYLVDGHGGKGVSGGPLWHWDEETNDYEVIGLCSSYLKSGDADMPGMVVFESINPLVGYLTGASGMEMNIIGKGDPPSKGSS